MRRAIESISAYYTCKKTGTQYQAMHLNSEIYILRDGAYEERVFVNSSDFENWTSRMHPANINDHKRLIKAIRLYAKEGEVQKPEVNSNLDSTMQQRQSQGQQQRYFIPFSGA